MARRLGRPVLLSVGYSTRHWCHVMEEESFEDEEVARAINENYIPIKVDREERPAGEKVCAPGEGLPVGRGSPRTHSDRAGKVALGGRTTAYVCETQSCKLPTTDPERFAGQLREVFPLPR